jgi:hypothetical protein
LSFFARDLALFVGHRVLSCPNAFALLIGSGWPGISRSLPFIGPAVGLRLVVGGTFIDSLGGSHDRHGKQCQYCQNQRSHRADIVHRSNSSYWIRVAVFVIAFHYLTRLQCFG